MFEIKYGKSVRKVTCFAAVLLAVLMVSACAGGGQAQGSDADAVAAADAALAGMGASPTGGQSTGGGSQARGSANRAGPAGEPAWVSAPDAVFNRASFMAAVGYGSGREVAEKNAFANLTALFGQSIQGDQVVTARYSEAVRNGAVASWTEDTAMTNAIKTSVDLESLVGAEIRDYWYDGKSTHYAVAVMDRQKTAALYADMIRSNEKIITDLITMPERVKNSLDGYSRYSLAGTIADANRAFANVLSVAGNAGTGINPADMKKGDDYRLEAANITKTIPITVRVTNDRSDRIRGAFAAVFNKAGFRSGGNNSRYALNVTVTISEVQLANPQNKFARYVVDANLTDSVEGIVLLPYNINGREGHLTLPEAENRALAAAERRINEAYGTVLSDYLSTLLPAH
jgi:hypothetical protein